MSKNIVTVVLNDRLVVDEAPLINYWDQKTPLRKTTQERDHSAPDSCGEIHGEYIIKELYQLLDLNDEAGFVSVFVVKISRAGRAYLKLK